MNSLGVEISIAACIKEMVRRQLHSAFILYFFCFLFHVLCFIIDSVQRLHTALAMEEKTHPMTNQIPSGTKLSTHVPLGRNQPPPPTPNKKFNPD